MFQSSDLILHSNTSILTQSSGVLHPHRMPTPLTDDQIKILPMWEPESRIADDTTIRGIIDNMLNLLAEPGRWDRVEKDGLLFVHDTGILMQFTRHANDHPFQGGKISQFVAFWLDDMLPFRIRMERGDGRFDNSTVGETFLRDYAREETRETIERIGVIAALCRE